MESPTRKSPFNSLSSIDQKKSFEELRHEKKMVEQSYKRLFEKNSEKCTDLQLLENSIPHMQVKTACSYIKENWNKSKKQLLDMIMEIQMDSKTEKVVSDEERDRLVSYLSESIDNLSLQINGKSKRCRYSSHAVNIAMCLFIKSKTAYTLLREQKLMSLPSPELLKIYITMLRPSPGIDPRSMLFMKDIVGRHKGKIKGHLMMDEIKLKNGIMWNCMNGAVTGFIADELNSKDLMLDILGITNTKKSDTRQLSAYANQWRFRSTRGIVHNSFFYFNKGSLTANEIAQQFTDVLLFYETVGVQISGLVCDGGSSNESFLHNIVDKFNFDAVIPDKESLSFIHSLDKTRRIYLWSCGTHSQKALRNNLYRSRKNGTRNLKYSNCYFGWNELQTIYERDEARSNRQEYRRTDVVQQTVNLDSFTMMNATYAKQPFTSKTLSEVFNHLSVQLNVKLDNRKMYPSEWHKFEDYCVKLSKAPVPKHRMHLNGELALLKYQVAVHGIYVERLLNKIWKLTAANVDKEQQIMTNILSFFSKWSTEISDSNVKKHVSNKIGEKYFIAKKTHHNMISLVYGFLGYAKMILNESLVDEYVPTLHCNQNSIEVLFSHIRMMGRDRTDLYGVGILQHNISNCLKYSNVYSKSKSYPINKEKNQCKHKDYFKEDFCFNTLCNTIKNANKSIDIIVKRCFARKQNVTVTYLLPRNQSSNLTVQGIVMYPKLKDYVLPDKMTFQQYLLTDNRFLDIMILFHGKIEFKWIEMLVNDENELAVNNVFQHIVLVTYTKLSESNSNNVQKGQFHLSMIKEMQKYYMSEFEYIFKEYFPQMYEDTNMNYSFRWLLINFMKQKFLTEWVTKLILQMKNHVIASVGNKETNKKHVVLLY